MDRDAWSELVAAHAALDALHSGAAALLPQFLDALTDAAASNPGQLQQVTEWRTAATTFLQQHADVLADLERAITAVEPPGRGLGSPEPPDGAPLARFSG